MALINLVIEVICLHLSCSVKLVRYYFCSLYVLQSALRDDVIKDNFYSKYSSSAFIRRKRSGNECYSARKKPTTCNLYLRADPVLFKETIERLGVGSFIPLDLSL